MAHVYTKSFTALSPTQTLAPQLKGLAAFSSSTITLSQIAEQLRREASHQLELKPTLGQVFTQSA